MMTNEHEQLADLLEMLLDAQTDWINHSGYNAKAVLERRDRINDKITSKFAALCQQRDVLVEVLEAIARGSHCARAECCIDSPSCGPMIARAALVSVKKGKTG